VNAVRSALFVIWMYGLMAVMGLIWLPSLLLPRGALLFGIRLYTRLLRWGLDAICGIRTEIRGADHIPDGALLIAGKHQCMWDVFVPFLMVRDPAIIMKRELLWYPILGWYALKCSMIPIDRGGFAKTLKQMVRAAKVRADKGRQVLIFPEGTRQAPGAPPDYKAAGVSALYRDLDVPCLPIATNSGLCWPARGFVRTPGRVIYEALPAIPQGENRKTLMRTLEANLEQASNALLEEGLAAQGRTRDALETA